MRKTSVSLLMILLLCSSLPLNASAGPSDDIPTNASNTGVHNSLVAALGHADLVSTLQGPGPFTVFAPTDQAFADAGIDLADFDTDEENETLSNILLHHVLSGEVTSSMLTDGMLAQMVNGDKVKFGVGATVTVGDATVTSADVVSSNGIIHVIDKVLMPPADIPTTAGTTGIHNSLVAAVVQADLLATLEGPGPFTVFAPTDQAFTDAGISLAALDTPEGKVTLADILLYHVVSSEVPASAVTDCMSADAANGQPLSFTVGDGVMVNDANVVSTDVVTSNGLIHVIDKVLTPSDTPRDIPRTAQCTGTHDSLVAAVIQAELLETLQGPGPFTVFAPTDQAFTDAGIDLASMDTPEGKAALANILLYHVVSGEVASSALSDGMTAETVNGQDLTFNLTSGVMVNDASVTAADIATSNGIIHVIDKVLMPLGDITDIAAGTGIHTSLVAALIQAELVETLQGDGPFTVFAPTDQAFADAGIDLATFDTPEGKETLANILLYHVVAGEVASSALTDGMNAEAVNGDELTFDLTSGVMVNDASVTTADVVTSNGIIHVIDKVLMPLGDITDIAAGTGIHTSLVAALIQAELVETLQGEGPFTVFAPTDQAFADAGIDLAALDTPEGKETLANILLYHVVAANVPSSAVTDCMTADAANSQPLAFTVGSSVMVNGATVTLADVSASNGVIHVIDKVLTPSDNPNNIPRTAQCTGVHTSLVAALIQAELVETLQGDGPFTVFAPTDQAFADAGIDLAALDTPEGKETLANILLYHVVSGEVTSSALTDGMVAEAVNGDELTFDLTSGVMVNGASVTTADVTASNGIIHVIDKVLMPPTDEGDSSDEAKSSSDDDDSSYTIWIVIGLIVIIGGAGAVLFMRSKDSEPLMEKDLSGLLGQLEPVEATAYATQTVQQQYPAQLAQVAQPAQVTQPVQMTQVVQQPVVAEPAVLRQWTDEAGYTWRSTDDGNTYWWNGADWQKHG